jgi:PadR family transcriptional regulator PadR
MPNGPDDTTAQRDLFRGALEMMILQSLRREPMHGYPLVQHIKESSNHLLQVEEGSLYPALQRMLKEKLVRENGSFPQPTAEFR